MKKINIYKTLMVLVGVLFFYSCSQNEDVLVAPRLFRPVLALPLTATDNSIKVTLAALKDVVSYKIEISKDNFVTSKFFETTSPYFIIKGLLWNKEYQVRATAISADPAKNSLVAELGKVKTDRFPSILAIPVSDDIIDNGLNVRWTVSGAAVTSIKIYAPADEEFVTPLASYTTTAAQQLSGLRSVKLLKPLTSYTVAIFSGDVLRGYETFTTKAALPTTGNILDLRGDNDFDPLTDDGSYLTAKLDIAQTQPTTVILDGDQSYILNGYKFSNSIKIISGYSLTSGGAIVNVKNNFDTAAGTSAIASIIFDGIKFKGSGIGGNYLFAPNTDKVTITDFKIINCTVSDFRGMFRLRGSAGGEITNFLMDNCDISQIDGYMVLNTDNAAWDWKNAVFNNCTIHQIHRLAQNKHSGSNFNLSITNCTLYEIGSPSNPLISVSGGAKLANLTVSNTLLGRGWDTTNTNYAFVFISDTAQVLLAKFDNVYDTAECAYTTLKGPADLGATVVRYSGTSTDLFTDPANSNFTYKDKAFAGKGSVGALRWRL